MEALKADLFDKSNCLSWLARLENSTNTRWHAYFRAVFEHISEALARSSSAA